MVGEYIELGITGRDELSPVLKGIDEWYIKLRNDAQSYGTLAGTPDPARAERYTQTINAMSEATRILMRAQAQFAGDSPRQFEQVIQALSNVQAAFQELNKAANRAYQEGVREAEKYVQNVNRAYSNINPTPQAGGGGGGSQPPSTYSSYTGGYYQPPQASRTFGGGPVPTVRSPLEAQAERDKKGSDLLQEIWKEAIEKQKQDNKEWSEVMQSGTQGIGDPLLELARKRKAEREAILAEESRSYEGMLKAYSRGAPVPTSVFGPASLKGASEGLGEVTKSSDEAFRTLSALEIALSRVSAPTGAWSVGLRALSFHLDAATQAAVSLGTVFAGIGASILVSFGKMVQSAVDFDKAIGMVRAVVGRETFAKFGDEVEHVANVLGQKTIYSSSQAAEAIAQLVKSGLPLEDALHGAASAALGLAAATGEDVVTSAKTAAQVMRIFHDELASGTLTFTNVTDVMVRAVSQAGIELTSFRYAIEQVGPLAAELHQPFNLVAAAIGVMSRNGLQGEKAGSALNQMLQHLAPTSSRTYMVMAQLGLGIQGTANSFFDAAGKMKPLDQIADSLANTIGKLNDKEKLQVATMLFGTSGARAAIIMANARAQGIQDMAKALDQAGAAEEASLLRLHRLYGATEQLKSSAETAAISFGGALAPALMLPMNALKDILDIFSGLPQPMQAVIATMLTMTGVAMTLAGAFTALTVVTARMGMGGALSVGGLLGGAGSVLRMGASGAAAGLGLPILGRAAAAPVAGALTGASSLLDTAILGMTARSAFPARAAVAADAASAGLMGLAARIAPAAGATAAGAGTVAGAAATGAASTTAFSVALRTLGLSFSSLMGILAPVTVGLIAYNTNLLGARDITNEVASGMTRAWTDFGKIASASIEDVVDTANRAARNEDGRFVPRRQQPSARQQGPLGGLAEAMAQSPWPVVQALSVYPSGQVGESIHGLAEVTVEEQNARRAYLAQQSNTAYLRRLARAAATGQISPEERNVAIMGSMEASVVGRVKGATQSGAEPDVRKIMEETVREHLAVTTPLPSQFEDNPEFQAAIAAQMEQLYAQLVANQPDIARRAEGKGESDQYSKIKSQLIEHNLNLLIQRRQIQGGTFGVLQSLYATPAGQSPQDVATTESPGEIKPDLLSIQNVLGETRRMAVVRNTISKLSITEQDELASSLKRSVGEIGALKEAYQGLGVSEEDATRILNGEMEARKLAINFYKEQEGVTSANTLTLQKQGQARIDFVTQMVGSVGTLRQQAEVVAALNRDLTLPNPQEQLGAFQKLAEILHMDAEELKRVAEAGGPAAKAVAEVAAKVTEYDQRKAVQEAYGRAITPERATEMGVYDQQQQFANQLTGKFSGSTRAQLEYLLKSEGPEGLFRQLSSITGLDVSKFQGAAGNEVLPSYEVEQGVAAAANRNRGTQADFAAKINATSYGEYVKALTERLPAAQRVYLESVREANGPQEEQIKLMAMAGINAEKLKAAYYGDAQAVLDIDEAMKRYINSITRASSVEVAFRKGREALAQQSVSQLPLSISAPLQTALTENPEAGQAELIKKLGLDPATFTRAVGGDVEAIYQLNTATRVLGNTGRYAGDSFERLTKMQGMENFVQQLVGSLPIGARTPFEKAALSGPAAEQKLLLQQTGLTTNELTQAYEGNALSAYHVTQAMELLGNQVKGTRAELEQLGQEKALDQFAQQFASGLPGSLAISYSAIREVNGALALQRQLALDTGLSVDTLTRAWQGNITAELQLKDAQERLRESGRNTLSDYQNRYAQQRGETIFNDIASGLTVAQRAEVEFIRINQGMPAVLERLFSAFGAPARDLGIALSGTPDQTTAVINSIKESMKNMPKDFDFGSAVDTAAQANKGDRLVGDIARNLASQFYNTTTQDAVAGAGADIAKTFADNVGDGFVQNTPTVVSTLSSGISGAVDQVKEDVKAKMLDVGESIAVGIASGIENATGVVTDAIKQLLQTANDSAKEKAEIKSPSQLFAREVGRPITQGIGVGIKDAEPQLNDDVEQIIANMTASAQRQLALPGEHSVLGAEWAAKLHLTAPIGSGVDKFGEDKDPSQYIGASSRRRDNTILNKWDIDKIKQAVDDLNDTVDSTGETIAGVAQMFGGGRGGLFRGLSVGNGPSLVQSLLGVGDFYQQIPMRGSTGVPPVNPPNPLFPPRTYDELMSQHRGLQQNVPVQPLSSQPQIAAIPYPEDIVDAQGVQRAIGDIAISVLQRTAANARQTEQSGMADYAQYEAARANTNAQAQRRWDMLSSAEQVAHNRQVEDQIAQLRQQADQYARGMMQTLPRMESTIYEQVVTRENQRQFAPGTPIGTVFQMGGTPLMTPEQYQQGMANRTIHVPEGATVRRIPESEEAYRARQTAAYQGAYGLSPAAGQISVLQSTGQYISRTSTTQPPDTGLSGRLQSIADHLQSLPSELREAAIRDYMTTDVDVVGFLRRFLPAQPAASTPEYEDQRIHREQLEERRRMLDAQRPSDPGQIMEQLNAIKARRIELDEGYEQWISERLGHPVVPVQAPPSDPTRIMQQMAMNKFDQFTAQVAAVNNSVTQMIQSQYGDSYGRGAGPRFIGQMAGARQDTASAMRLESVDSRILRSIDLLDQSADQMEQTSTSINGDLSTISVAWSQTIATESMRYVERLRTGITESEEVLDRGFITGRNAMTAYLQEVDYTNAFAQAEMRQLGRVAQGTPRIAEGDYRGEVEEDLSYSARRNMASMVDKQYTNMLQQRQRQVLEQLSTHLDLGQQATLSVVSQQQGLDTALQMAAQLTHTPPEVLQRMVQSGQQQSTTPPQVPQAIMASYTAGTGLARRNVQEVMGHAGVPSQELQQRASLGDVSALSEIRSIEAANKSMEESAKRYGEEAQHGWEIAIANAQKFTEQAELYKALWSEVIPRSIGTLGGKENIEAYKQWMQSGNPAYVPAGSGGETRSAPGINPIGYGYTNTGFTQFGSPSSHPSNPMSNPNLGGVPRFALGGIVTQPTLAIVGEAGPEIISPFSLGGAGDTYHQNAGMYIGTLNAYNADTTWVSRVARTQRRLLGWR